MIQNIILSSSNTTTQTTTENFNTAENICYSIIFADDNEINTSVKFFLYFIIPFFLVNIIRTIFKITQNPNYYFDYYFDDEDKSTKSEKKYISAHKISNNAKHKIEGAITSLVFILPSLLIVTFYLALAQYVAAPGMNNSWSFENFSLTPTPNSVESIYPQVMGFYLMAIFLPILIFGTSLFVAIKNNRKNDYVTIGVLFIFSEIISNIFVYLLLSNGFFSMEMFVFFVFFIFGYFTGLNWKHSLRNHKGELYDGLMMLGSITGIFALWLVYLTINTIASNPQAGFVYPYNDFCNALGSEYVEGDTVLWFIFFFIVYIILSIALSFVATSNTISVEKKNILEKSHTEEKSQDSKTKLTNK